jgi:2-polyprenyl-3-methyl-5-hydroxy-6-metoxy-1,4-benzoquinol methylase
MKQNNIKSNNSFDETYNKEEEFFGHPYQELQNFFQKYPIKGKLLDLGSGQGRDSIFLASIGYKVTAIDNSKVGVSQMQTKAKEKNLNIRAIAEDVLKVKLEEKFNIILMDMLLHTFTKDKQRETLKKFIKNLEVNGVFCIVFPDDINSGYFMELLNSLSNNWKLKEKIIIKDVPKISDRDSDFSFKMIVVKLIS